MKFGEIELNFVFAMLLNNRNTKKKLMIMETTEKINDIGRENRHIEQIIKVIDLYIRYFEH